MPGLNEQCTRGASAMSPREPWNDAAAAQNQFVHLVKRLRDLSVNDVWDFWNCTHAEIQRAGYPQQDIDRILDRTYGAGRLDSPAYYRQTMCKPLQRATTSILSRYTRPRILDVACGTGTQAIFFALAGAEVVGIDRDEGQLETLKRRAEYYQQTTGAELRIDARLEDVHQLDVNTLGDFDMVYSRGGVGRFMTADEIFSTFRPILRTGGLIALQNGNPQCLWSDLARTPRTSRDSSTRREYLQSARQHGFHTLLAEGTTGLPPQMWILGEIVHVPDWLLRRVVRLQLHLEFIFEKL